MEAIKTFLIWTLPGISLTIAFPVINAELSETIIKEYENYTLPEVLETDFKIYFYDQENTANDIQVDITDKEAMQLTSFSNTKQTILIIHGWNRNVSSDVCTSMKNALLAAQDVNIFIVDWSKLTGNAYIESFLLLRKMGTTLANMIRTLETNNGLDLDKTAMIGHSLGAHIAGLTGTALDGECDYIVGLDPSAPLFMYNITYNRLTTSSAKFVQIIHTCGSLLGMSMSIGITDYYPNGGMIQDGCGEDITRVCSQDRSYMYYAESIASGHFAAVKCDSYEEYENGTCAAGSTSWMGGFNIDKSAYGSYFLDTNSSPPFAKSKQRSFQ